MYPHPTLINIKGGNCSDMQAVPQGGSWLRNCVKEEDLFYCCGFIFFPPYLKKEINKMII